MRVLVRVGSALLVGSLLAGVGAVGVDVLGQPVVAEAATKKPKMKKLSKSAQKKQRAVGSTVTVKGKNLKKIKTVKVGHAKAKIVKKTNSKITFKIPNVKPGKKYKVNFYYAKRKGTSYWAGNTWIRVKKDTSAKVTKVSSSNGGGYAYATVSGKYLKKVTKVTFSGKTGKITSKSNGTVKAKSHKYTHTGTKKFTVKVYAGSKVLKTFTVSIKGTGKASTGNSGSGSSSNSSGSSGGSSSGSSGGSSSGSSGSSSTTESALRSQLVSTTNSTISAFRTKYNALRSAAGLPTVPTSRIRSGDSLPAEARKSGCSAGGQFEHTKDVWVRYYVTGYANAAEMHSGQCFDWAEVAVDVAGAYAAQAWWESDAHKDNLYQPNRNYEFWDKDKAIEVETQALLDSGVPQATLDRSGVNAGYDDWYSYQAATTDEQCLYYVSVDHPSGNYDAAATAAWGACTP